MTDPIRAMTAQLAEDPASLVFLALGEELRRRRQLDAAVKVASTGLARYPELAEAHDLLARILADRGDNAEAFESWANALRIAPDHLGANKGIGFLYFKAGDPVRALEHLELASHLAPEDAGLAGAIARVRDTLPIGQAGGDAAGGGAAGGNAAGDEAAGDEAAGKGPASRRPAAVSPAASPPAASPPAAVPPAAVPPAAVSPADLPFELDEDEAGEQVFDGLEGASDGLLLLDARGLRLGGGLRSQTGADVADAVAAHLAGVSREADRAARLLGLGHWQSVAVESPDGNLHLVAPTPDSLLLTLRGAAVPAGRLALIAERAAGVARRWLERLG